MCVTELFYNYYHIFKNILQTQTAPLNYYYIAEYARYFTRVHWDLSFEGYFTVGIVTYLKIKYEFCLYLTRLAIL